MKKKSLLALLVAAVMLLSGCSLVLRDSEVDGLQTIIDVNGETVNKNDFLNTYSYNLSVEQYYASIYSQLGLSYTVDEQEVLSDTANTIITDLVLRQKLTELGLDVFTEEENAALDADAQEQLQGYLDNVREQYFADSELTGEALDEAVAEYAAANLGYTFDSVRENVKDTELSNRLRAYVTDPVTITDDDLQAALDEKIASEKASYESSLAAYGAAANQGTYTYYVPAGYRAIRFIQVAKPAAEEAAETTEEAPVAEEKNEALAEAEALLERLNNGETIDALGLDVSEYIVCESSTDVADAIVAAVFALTEKGYTGVIEGESAYYIAEYVDDVAEHTATLEETRDLLYDDTLSAAQTAAYNDAVNAWVEAASITIYSDRLN